ncbi:MAG TPA: hypothetical protein VNU01_05595, partial [Egibacteraceae bacterium]|nr:hypothetical protein [Egibacteraceae bacterium]
QFVDPATRFTSGPARALLRDGVFDGLPPEQRAAMGVQYQPVAGVVPGAATGEATVLFEQGRAYAVSIDYRLELELHYPRGPETATPAEQQEPVELRQPLSHSGTVLFTAPSWAVESFEFRTKAPDVPVPPPAPSPTTGEVAS